MKELENMQTLYIYEQNLLKSCTNKIIASSNDLLHDNLLCIFDNIDEVNRKLYNHLKKNNLIKKEYVNNKRKENVYEELDYLLLKINE